MLPCPKPAFAVSSRLRILVVDDDPLIIRALCETLESDGHEVITANGGEAGIDERSLQIDSARHPDLLLAYAMNGEPLPIQHGYPVRLIVPGWYGIANVKWLTRIEVRDRRYMGRFMGRDYVTVRGERRGKEIVYVETSAARMNLKSVVARVTRRPIQNGVIPLKAYCVAWNDGTEIRNVEVRVDQGPWRAAVADAKPHSKYCWKFYSLDLGAVAPGKHTIVSRAIDVNGRIQPTADDDEIALKKTYWEAYQQWPREIEVAA